MSIFLLTLIESCVILVLQPSSTGQQNGDIEALWDWLRYSATVSSIFSLRCMIPRSLTRTTSYIIRNEGKP